MRRLLVCKYPCDVNDDENIYECGEERGRYRGSRCNARIRVCVLSISLERESAQSRGYADTDVIALHADQWQGCANRGYEAKASARILRNACAA